jgi:hypothetical protein
MSKPMRILPFRISSVKNPSVGMPVPRNRSHTFWTSVVLPTPGKYKHETKKNYEITTRARRQNESEKYLEAQSTKSVVFHLSPQLQPFLLSCSLLFHLPSWFNFRDTNFESECSSKLRGSRAVDWKLKRKTSD